MAICLKIGLQISDLKLLTYSDIMKILASYISEDENKAKQTDIDRLLG